MWHAPEAMLTEVNSEDSGFFYIPLFLGWTCYFYSCPSHKMLGISNKISLVVLLELFEY